MRLDPKLVHPSIFKATDGALWSGRYAAPAAGRDAKMVAEHQRVWFKEYGKGCFLYAALSCVAFFGAIPIAVGMAKPWKALFLLGVMAAIALAGVFAYLRNLRQLTAPELAALLPMLDLTEGQRAYAETLVALERSGRPRAEIEETMAALNALLDEEARLIGARDLVRGSQQGREPLVQERERLALRAAEAHDAEARLAYETSLALLGERLAAFDAQGSQIERIDAHLELLRQAVLATRDAAHHRSAAPAGPDLGTDALRSAVALARAQSQATERALAELNAT